MTTDTECFEQYQQRESACNQWVDPHALESQCCAPSSSNEMTSSRRYRRRAHSNAQSLSERPNVLRCAAPKPHQRSWRCCMSAYLALGDDYHPTGQSLDEVHRAWAHTPQSTNNGKKLSCRYVAQPFPLSPRCHEHLQRKLQQSCCSWPPQNAIPNQDLPGLRQADHSRDQCSRFGHLCHAMADAAQDR